MEELMGGEAEGLLQGDDEKGDENLSFLSPLTFLYSCINLIISIKM